MAPKSSLMDDYMATYGQRLQSLLSGQMTPDQARGAPAVPMQASPSALGGPPQAAPGPGAPPPGASPAAAPAPGQAAPAQGGGTSFRQKWEESSTKERDQATDDLEKQLKAGNQTIDSAYDQLINQLGERPSSSQKMTRQEKGMFLMEFGLSLLANSNGKAYGQDLGGAVGASGLSALQNFQQRRQSAGDEYSKNALAINTKRADAKADLAKQSALEARSEARDQRRLDRENSQIAGVVTQPDNTVVGYTRGGQASALELPGGQAVKSKPKPPPGTGGAAGGRTLVEDRRYQMYMDLYGKDGTGKPLDGPQLDAVKKRALQFAVDPKASTMSDAEIRAMAERSTDAFMKSNWAQFRDMKPDEINAWRNKSADSAYKRLKAGDDAAHELPATPKPTSALEGGGKSKSYTSQDQIRSALQSKEINFGDTVMLNGKPFKIQPKQRAQ